MRHLGLIVALAACGHSHSHEEAHVAEPAAREVTMWTATHELFVEYPPFVVGQIKRLWSGPVNSESARTSATPVAPSMRSMTFCVIVGRAHRNSPVARSRV